MLLSLPLCWILASQTPVPQEGKPASPPTALPAPGELLVAPPRVILDGRKRTAEVVLLNTGTRKATYRVSFVQMAMDEAGNLQDRTAPAGEVNASDMLRFSPRQVTLEPGVSQVVRLQVRKPADLPEGEYRSHLLFQAIPTLEARRPTPNPEAKALSISLIPIPGVSIPVYVRHGETRAQAQLSELSVVKAQAGAPPQLNFRLTRQGTQTLYGDLTVTHEPASGPKTVVGFLKELPIYHPLTACRIRVPLSSLPSGPARLRVRYTEPEGKALLAEAVLDLK